MVHKTLFSILVFTVLLFVGVGDSGAKINSSPQLKSIVVGNPLVLHSLFGAGDSGSRNILLYGVGDTGSRFTGTETGNPLQSFRGAGNSGA